MKSADIAKRYRIDQPGKFKLKDFDPGNTAGLDRGKSEFKGMLKADAERLGKLQERLYAEGRWSVLIVLQGMDASGKDGIVSHVLSGVNPLGCVVHAFKAPNSEELKHDFLWRTTLRLPERGRI